MRPIPLTMVLLTSSNVCMMFAWYAHRKEMGQRPRLFAALVAWAIALFEYLLPVPASRIGFTVMSVGQPKILQEVITQSVSVPLSPFGAAPAVPQLVSLLES